MMGDFTDKIRLRGKAEENIYFDKLNSKLIEAMHEKMNKRLAQQNGNKKSKNNHLDLSENNKSK